MPRLLRELEPLKMTSAISPPRSDLADCSPRIRRTAPLLELDCRHVFALLVVEILLERFGVFLPDLGRGAADENERVAAIVEDRNRPPALCLGFGLDEHRSDPPWPRLVI